jgi:hypothetical protein
MDSLQASKQSPPHSHPDIRTLAMDWGSMSVPPLPSADAPVAPGRGCKLATNTRGRRGAGEAMGGGGPVPSMWQVIFSRLSRSVLRREAKRWRDIIRGGSKRSGGGGEGGEIAGTALLRGLQRVQHERRRRMERSDRIRIWTCFLHFCGIERCARSTRHSELQRRPETRLRPNASEATWNRRVCVCLHLCGGGGVCLCVVIVCGGGGPRGRLGGRLRTLDRHLGLDPEEPLHHALPTLLKLRRHTRALRYFLGFSSPPPPPLVIRCTTIKVGLKGPPLKTQLITPFMISIGSV